MLLFVVNLGFGGRCILLVVCYSLLLTVIPMTQQIVPKSLYRVELGAEECA